MIVSSPGNMPFVEIEKVRHPTMGHCLKILQNPTKYVYVPLDAVVTLADSLIDCHERIENR